MVVRIDKMDDSKDIKTIDEVVVIFEDQAVSIPLDEENYRNSLNIKFDSLDEAKKVFGEMAKAINACNAMSKA